MQWLEQGTGYVKIELKRFIYIFLVVAYKGMTFESGCT